MKKYWILSLVISISFFYNYINAQEKQMPFFEKNGTVSIQTTALNSLADTISVINHRYDDVVWSRIVYRIIDMRDKQNYQLYFPVLKNDQYKSLFRVILEAAVNDSNYLIKGGDGYFVSGPYQGLKATFCGLLEPGNWTHTQSNTDIPPPMFTSPQLIQIVKYAMLRKNVPIMNVEVYQDGSISDETFELLKQLNKSIH